MELPAIVFVCAVGGVYSLFLLGDCYGRWKAWPSGEEDVSPTRRKKRDPRSSPKDWWCQAIAGVTFLVVAAMLLSGACQDFQQPADGHASREVNLVPIVQVPDMLAVPRRNIARGRDRPGQPVYGVNLAYLPATDADIHALLKEGAEIEYVVLNGTDISDEGLVYLRQMPCLNELGVGRTQITDAGCEELAQIATLEVLDLSRTGITDEGLEHLSKLTNLRSLSLHKTLVSDSGLKSLQKLRRLELFSVSGPNVTEQGVRVFKEKMPRLACY